jgi:hypothetical protein
MKDSVPFMGLEGSLPCSQVDPPHRTQSRTRWIQSTPSALFKIDFYIFILPFTHVFLVVSSLQIVQSKFCMRFPSPICPAYHLLTWSYTNIWRRVQIVKLLIAQFIPASCSCLLVQIFSFTLCYQTPSMNVLPVVWNTKFHTHTKQRLELVFSY